MQQPHHDKNQNRNQLDTQYTEAQYEAFDTVMMVALGITIVGIGILALLSQ